MNNGDQLKKANETHLHHTSLMLACQDLESATYAARKAREDLRRATAASIYWQEIHADALSLADGADTAEDEARAFVRVDFARWALGDAKRNVGEKLEDYRSALKRVEVLGATAGEADSHEVPAYLRHRARKAIALADAFGNKVAMDATLHEKLERPRLPELSPEVEVTEFAVIDPLEPVEAWTAPEPRAVLVPVDDYSAPSTITFEDPREARAARLRQSREEEVAYAERLAYLEAEGRALEGAREDEPEHMSPEDEEAALRLYRILTGEIPAPDEGGDDDGSTVPEEDRMHEGERAAFWREVNHAQEDDAEKAREAAEKRWQETDPRRPEAGR